MAFALLMADKQWGGYASVALTQIQAVWNHEIWDSKLPRNGDGWGDWNNLNISYFAPAYYRLFKTVDTDPSHKWDDVVKTSYDTITVGPQVIERQHGQWPGAGLVHELRRRGVAGAGGRAAVQLSVRFLPHTLPHRRSTGAGSARPRRGTTWP